MRKRSAIALTALSLLYMQTVGTAPIMAATGEPSPWAKTEVNEAIAYRLVPEVPVTGYTQPVTREQFCKIAVSLYETLTGSTIQLRSSNPFRDTGSVEVRKAYAAGIVSGTSANTFTPDAEITREQIAVMLANALRQGGMPMNVTASSSVAASFADQAAVSSWAVGAVATLSAQGIMQGMEENGRTLFHPELNTTYEQAVVLADRIYKRYKSAAPGTSGTAPAASVHSEQELLQAVEDQRAITIAPDAGTVRQVYQKAQDILSSIIKPNMSDYDKEKAIHDFLVLHIAYDYTNYQKDTVPDDSYRLSGALLNGVAVCEGYALSAKLLLNMAGIEAYYVTGTGNGVAHAWNKVKIDGDYYNLDVTWDDPVPDRPGEVQYTYFNVTDEELSQDHAWHDSLPAAVSMKANYFVKNDEVVNGLPAFEARLREAVASHTTTFTVKVTGVDSPADLIGSIVFASGSVSRYAYTTTGEGNVLTITLTYR